MSSSNIFCALILNYLFVFLWLKFFTQEKEATVEKPRPKVPEIKAPGGGQVLEAPRIEVIREQTPDRKSSLAPGVYCLNL